VTAVWLQRRDCSRRDTREEVKRLGSHPDGGGGDSPLTHRALRYRHDCSTVVRISSAAAGIGSTPADGPFFRAVEPERRGSHTVVARLPVTRDATAGRASFRVGRL
jgi:hypothetical protein